MTSGYAITTLAMFVVSVFFVIHPISVPTTSYMPRIPINLTTAPILAIGLLWTAKCLDPAVIRGAVVGTEGVKPYNILILFFSLAYMATTLDITGILQVVAFKVSKKGNYNGWKLYFYFYVMLALLSVSLGNGLVILFGTAYLAHYTAIARLDPVPWIMAGFAAANTASMLLFLGNPANMIICDALVINNAVFTAYTILPFLTSNLFCFVALAFQFRNQVPPNIAPHSPCPTLLDPVGARVGSFMFGVMLILCLVVGFFGIDVWMIGLPLAIGKLSFDLGWDHYRHSRGISMLGRRSPKAVNMVVEGSAVGNSTGRKTSTLVKASFTDGEQSSPFPLDEEIALEQSGAVKIQAKKNPFITCDRKNSVLLTLRQLPSRLDHLHDRLDQHFPTVINALPRLPFILVPLIFSQFVLVEALDHQGWINVFAHWLNRTSRSQLHPTIWLIGIVCVVLCNLAGTNVGATILLTKIIRAAGLPQEVNRGAAIALAVAANIGAVSFTFSASPSGLLWRSILKEEGIQMSPRDFAFRNLVPVLVMTTVGLGVVSAEMAILHRS